MPVHQDLKNSTSTNRQRHNSAPSSSRYTTRALRRPEILPGVVGLCWRLRKEKVPLLIQKEKVEADSLSEDPFQTDGENERGDRTTYEDVRILKGIPPVRMLIHHKMTGQYLSISENGSQLEIRPLQDMDQKFLFWIYLYLGEPISKLSNGEIVREMTHVLRLKTCETNVNRCIGIQDSRRVSLIPGSGGEYVASLPTTTDKGFFLKRLSVSQETNFKFESTFLQVSGHYFLTVDNESTCCLREACPSDEMEESLFQLSPSPELKDPSHESTCLLDEVDSSPACCIFIFHFELLS